MNADAILGNWAKLATWLVTLRNTLRLTLFFSYISA